MCTHGVSLLVHWNCVKQDRGWLYMVQMCLEPCPGLLNLSSPCMHAAPTVTVRFVHSNCSSLERWNTVCKRQRYMRMIKVKSCTHRLSAREQKQSAIGMFTFAGVFTCQRVFASMFRLCLVNLCASLFDATEPRHLRCCHITTVHFPASVTHCILLAMQNHCTKHKVCCLIRSQLSDGIVY